MSSPLLSSGPPSGGLVPMIDVIKDICDVTRILVVGKSGIGKSSLINCIFQTGGEEGEDPQGPEISHYTPGAANIMMEFYFKRNSNLRFHDSQGLEAGETKNFSVLKDFIVKRCSDELQPGDRVHVIWHCIATPTMGDRLLQSGDEEILKLCSDHSVPVVIVFTQYDKLVVSKELEIIEANPNIDDNQLDEKCQQAAKEEFQKACSSLIDRAESLGIPWLYVSTDPDFSNTLVELIQRSLECIKKQKPSEALSEDQYAQGVRETQAISAQFSATQRIDSKPKIETCIDLGKQKFWSGLAEGLNFEGKILSECLYVIHLDIVEVWNIAEQAPHFLRSHGFMIIMMELVKELSAQPKPDPADNPTPVTTVAEASTAFSSVITGALPIVTSGFALKWIYNKYSKTPATLRCFMAYIVDLVVIMNRAFKSEQPVTQDTMQDILNTFRREDQNRIHSAVRRFVAHLPTAGIVTGRDVTFEKIVELISEYTTDS